METPKQAIKHMMNAEYSISESLRNCVNNKYKGDIDAFLKSEFNIVKDGCLHVKWGENKGEKVSYTL